MATLTPGQAAALVQLRALLDQALRAAHVTTSVGRLTALVLLDAVNERVVHLAVQTLPGVEVGQRDTFETMHNKVKDALTSGWNVARSGWADVRTLHRSRNSAQHEGVGADPALLPAWSIATESYTESLVAAVFDVDLGAVHLASAVQDPELGSRLRRAEQLLEEGKPDEALGEIDAAFGPAFQRWRSVHKRIEGMRPRLPRELRNAGLGRIMEVARDLSAAQAFATNPGEYVWFMELRQASADTVTADEVQRALTFVFWWIVQWEAVDKTLMSNLDRIERANKRHRLEKARVGGDQSARIGSFAMAHVGRDGRTQVVFDISQVPAVEEHYSNWWQAVEERLKAVNVPGSSQWSFVWPAEVRVMVLPGVNTDALVTAVREVLHAAEVDAANAALQRTQAVARERDERERFLTEVRRRSTELPNWVREVYLADNAEIVGGEVQSQLRLTLSDDAARVQSVVTFALRTAGLVVTFSPALREVARVEPELAVENVVNALQLVDSEVRIKAAEAKRANEMQEAANAAMEAASADLQTRLAASLNL